MEHDPVILFCVNNPRSLEERQMLMDAGCRMRDCLGLCSRCFETRLVVVADEPIEGEDYGSILAHARTHREPGSRAAQPPSAHEKPRDDAGPSGLP